MENYTNLNALQISRECLHMIYETLEPEQAGKIIMALYEYFYQGVEPQFEGKLMNGIWNTVLKFTQTKADAFMRQHRNFFNKEENPMVKKDNNNSTHIEDKDAPTSSKGKTDNIRTFEDRMGSSIGLLEGKTYKDAMKLLTIQSKLADGSITEEEIRRYCDKQELVNQITIQDKDYHPNLAFL